MPWFFATQGHYRGKEWYLCIGLKIVVHLRNCAIWITNNEGQTQL